MKKLLFCLLGVIMLFAIGCNNVSKDGKEVKPKVVVVLSNYGAPIQEYTEKVYDKQIVYYAYEKDVKNLDSYMDKNGELKKILVISPDDEQDFITYYDTIIKK